MEILIFFAGMVLGALGVIVPVVFGAMADWGGKSHKVG